MIIPDIPLTLTVPAASCSDIQYLLVGVLVAQGISKVEDTISNNYQPLALNLQCSGVEPILLC